jgi:hypothetical protein
MIGAEVKPVGTRHIQTQVNNMTQGTTWSIGIGKNIGKAGTENSFIYTIHWPAHWPVGGQRRLLRLPTGCSPPLPPFPAAARCPGTDFTKLHFCRILFGSIFNSSSYFGHFLSENSKDQLIWVLHTFEPRYRVQRYFKRLKAPIRNMNSTKLGFIIEILVLCRTSMYVLLLQTIWAKKNLQKACWSPP